MLAKILPVLVLASVSWGQAPPHCTTKADEKKDPNCHIYSNSNVIYGTPKLVCPKYQHEQYIPEHCADTCPPYGVTCASVCLGVPAEDKCVDDIRLVTEREWQELMERLSRLEAKDVVREK